jgi:hypothetical protein
VIVTVVGSTVGVAATPASVAPASRLGLAGAVGAAGVGAADAAAGPGGALGVAGGPGGAGAAGAGAICSFRSVAFCLGSRSARHLRRNPQLYFGNQVWCHFAKRSRVHMHI